jgi:hypothetical protein
MLQKTETANRNSIPFCADEGFGCTVKTDEAMTPDEFCGFNSGITAD